MPDTRARGNNVQISRCEQGPVTDLGIRGHRLTHERVSIEKPIMRIAFISSDNSGGKRRTSDCRRERRLTRECVSTVEPSCTPNVIFQKSKILYSSREIPDKRLPDTRADKTLLRLTAFRLQGAMSCCRNHQHRCDVSILVVTSFSGALCSKAVT